MFPEFKDNDWYVCAFSTKFEYDEDVMRAYDVVFHS